MSCRRLGWEVRAFRAWLRLTGGRLVEEYEDELVTLFRERLDELGPSRLRRLALLARSVFDSLWHGGRARVDQPGPTRPRRSGPGPIWLDSVRLDMRYAVRSLRRRPLFAGVAVATLALGIGSATAMFSVVDGILIRDLPYEDPESLVSIWKAWPDWRDVDGLDYVWDHIHMPWEDYLSIRSGASTLLGLAAFQNDDAVLYGRGIPRTLSTGLASENLFELLGVAPVLGRDFAPDEVPPLADPAPVALLSHELWSSTFGADEGVLGESIRLETSTYQVVGVLPPGFRLGSDLITTHENGGAADDGLRDVWLPLGSDGVDCGNCFELLGRVAPGRTIDEVRAEVQSLLVSEVRSEQVARVEARKQILTRGYATPLLILMAAAGVLLLIACTNVAGLLLGEASQRGQEMSVRAALGARQGRIVRQLVTESALLGAAGALGGLAVAVVGVDALLSVAPPLPRLEEVEPSLRVLGFATAIGVGMGILFGLAPAVSLASRSAGGALRVRAGTGRATRAHRILVSAQVGLTVVLLVSAGLFGRSLTRVMEVDPGLDADRLATLGVDLPAGYPARDEEILVFYAELFAAIEEVPGVEGVSATSTLPFPGGTNSHSFTYERNGAMSTSTQWARWVDPSYFETVGIEVLRGRGLTSQDVAGAPGAMVVSESLARRNWGDASPLGALVRYFGMDWHVVGVVGDVRQKALGSPVEATFYVSNRQATRRSMGLVVRTESDPAGALPRIVDAVWSVDPEIPIVDAAPLAELIRASESDDRFRATLTRAFAFVAIVLASIGIFGVTARGVAARTAELGIRTALGAHRHQLLQLVVRDGVRISLIGVTGGLVLAFLTARAIGHLLYGVEPDDVPTFLSAASIAVGVSLAAAAIPARRATRIDPATAIVDD